MVEMEDLPAVAKQHNGQQTMRRQALKPTHVLYTYSTKCPAEGDVVHTIYFILAAKPAAGSRAANRLGHVAQN